MKRLLAYTLWSYAALLALLALGSSLLRLLRARLVDGLTLGDLVLVAAVLVYGFAIYTSALVVIRGTCKRGH
ncbi:hypothetical protein [Pyrobaculum calidifontis]|uniref:Uncharacterized protein n=1 Tax=Pyrobaculum calidifontis (strain DSM 21063 / JCM 11548 / VA1) TaxID=410359 RepID=A3MVC7_PYRCJ|nr:hypothetical protein [Pyrobaculum calidifontis]ABO08594.1 hypothetical protein Pcal_1169 [Pyrobaculum calidifontis JCM 11548]